MDIIQCDIYRRVQEVTMDVEARVAQSTRAFFVIEVNRQRASQHAHPERKEKSPASFLTAEHRQYPVFPRTR